MSGISIGERGDFELTFGSSAGQCERALTGVQGLAPRHFALRRRGDRMFLLAFRTKEGMMLNGKRMPANRWKEITRHDTIRLCGIPLTLNARLFLGRDRVGLETARLRYQLPGGGKVLCDGPYFRAKPGTLTAIMGPSGSGKSILLSLINGYNRPSSGHVLIGDAADPDNSYLLHESFAQVRDYIGYVPQDDVMIPQLTVRESLDYRLRLRFPDMESDIRTRLIEETCSRLGFADSRLQAFLDNRIGSAESGIRGLSGGERRRANIAHELITKPLILILDEPTSGLSSIDADKIVTLLHDLSKQDNLTVICTIHQPSKSAFSLFNHLMLINHGGVLAYYGEAASAVPYFARLTGTQCGDRNPAEYLMEMLDSPSHGPRLHLDFQKTPGMASPGAGPLAEDCAPHDPAGAKARSSNPVMARVRSQFMVLFRRCLAVLFKDRTNLTIILAQVPLIALLVFLGFHRFALDNRDTDEFIRTKYVFDSRYTVLGRDNWDQARQAVVSGQAPELEGKITMPNANRRASLYFLVAAAAIWFGLMGACKEIVTEQHIVKREVRSLFQVLPYLAAKMALVSLTVGVQTGILVLLVNVSLLHLSLTAATGLWLGLWLTAATAAALGLLVSGSFRSLHVVLTLVPLILIPQLLFGGLLRPPVAAAEATVFPGTMSALTIQRWGFQLALASDPYADTGMLETRHNTLTREELQYANNLPKLLSVRESGLLRLFFGWSAGFSVLLPVVCLSLAMLLFLILARRILAARLL